MKTILKYLQSKNIETYTHTSYDVCIFFKIDNKEYHIHKPKPSLYKFYDYNTKKPNGDYNIISGKVDTMKKCIDNLLKGDNANE